MADGDKPKKWGIERAKVGAKEDLLVLKPMNRMLLEMDINPELPAIKCPTLAIGCVHDPLRPPDQVKALAARIPGARYVEADSGHFMHVQSPAMFAEMVVPFLLAKS